MDAYRLAEVARAIGGEQVSLGAGKVQCACLLARWTHAKGRDSRPSMVIFPKGEHGDPIYSCLACHEKGSLRDLVLFLWSQGHGDMFPIIELLDGEDTGTAIRPTKKSERAKAIAPKVWKPPQAPVKVVKRDGKAFYDFMCVAKAEEVEEIPWDRYEPYAGAVPRYATADPPEGRGLAVETCKEWELGHDRDGKRLLFPMRDRKGRLIAISGRLYVDPEGDCLRCGGPIFQREGEAAACLVCGRRAPPKYLHSKGFDRNLHLYGENRKQDATDGRVYVVEGHIDALVLWQTGYRPVVATLGSHPGAAQIEKLIAYYDRIIVVPDGDGAGVDFAATVRKMVATRVPVTMRLPPRGTDPAHLGTRPDLVADGALHKLLGPPSFRVDTTLSMG